MATQNYTNFPKGIHPEFESPAGAKNSKTQNIMTGVFEYNGNLALESSFLWETGIMSYDNYKKQKRDGKIVPLQRGCRNTNAIISYNDLHFNLKRKVDSKLKEIGLIREVENKEVVCFFESFIKPDQAAMDYYNMRFEGDEKKITRYYTNAIVVTALHELLLRRSADRKARNKTGRQDAGLFTSIIVDLKSLNKEKYPHTLPLSERNLRPLMREFKARGYEALIHANEGNDHTRLVCERTENLILALWRSCDKPFVKMVHQKLMDFVNGKVSFYDQQTGELYQPEEFSYKGRRLDISEATVWHYVKKHFNNLSTYTDRNGNFDYYTTKRPKHERRNGDFSFSKVSADDSVLSRKGDQVWVARYHAVDVVSQYWFRPAYVVGGKPTLETVIEMYRNMFCEIDLLGLAIPGEMDIEHHLMKDIDWLKEVFPFVYFNPSPTSKRAEHSIRALKYGVAKKNGHTRGRWYAKHEAYKSVRTKVKGDFIEPEYNPRTIIADDLADIDEHNNQLHPNQKKYPGMTRREVMMFCVNPQLPKMDRSIVWKHIGNADDCTIYNSDYVMAANTKFNIANFSDLKKLKPNNCKVTAYWLPDTDGSVKEVIIYQGETFIGRAYNRMNVSYNECKVEMTDQDHENKLHQDKRTAKFDKIINDRKSEIPKIGAISAASQKLIQNTPVDIVEHNYNSDATLDLDELLERYCSDNFRKRAIESI